MYDKILDVAEELFMTRGYQATSTRQITEILGVTQPTIYYHFKSKEEIYFEVMRRLSMESKEQLEKIATLDELSLEDKMMQMVDSLKHRQPVNLFVMIHDIQHSLSPHISSELYQMFMSSYKLPFVRLLENNKDKLRDTLDVELAVSQLFILIASYLNNSSEEKGEPSDFSAKFDLFFYGIHR